jgi:hypothetical protein
MAIPNDVRQDVLKRLANDFSFKKRGDWLRGGKCPGCGKRELYTHADEPWSLKCGRENKCGWESNIKVEYPDAFENFNERYQPTNDNPNATADAYMNFSRGFPLPEIKGWYRQGKYWNPKAVGKQGTATVLFDIDRANNITMERFVETLKIRDPEDGSVKTQKAHFTNKYRGLVWVPPAFDPQTVKEIWFVEGCIDATSLTLKGIPAVAILGGTNYPEKFLEQIPKNVRLVWALDDDRTGRKYIKQHSKKAEEAGFICEAAIIPSKGKEKIDWNDAYIRGWLDKKENITNYRYHGELLLAKSPFDKAMITWARMGANHFAIDFGMKYYWFSLDLEKFNKALDGGMEREKAASFSGSIIQIANCHFEFLYFLKSKFTDESWYYAKVQFPHKNTVVKDTFSGGQVAASSEFKKRLLSIAAGALFTGKGNQLDWIINRHLSHIKTVETIDFIGYAKEYKAYIFDEMAIADGKEYPINDEDFFEIGKDAVKTMNKSVAITIGNKENYKPDWINHLWNAFGAEGVAALTFFFGTLFVEQIRGIQKSYPFLEVVGEAGAGKSTLIEFLWKLLGRDDYEGFDPNKETVASRARKFSQGANIPVSLIESDREDTAKVRQFDWDELKTAYNGRSHRGRGVKNSGNDTDDQPFRGSIVITQNNPVNASEAIMSRIVHFFFTTKNQTKESYKAAKALEAIEAKDVNYFIKMACLAEKNVLATVKKKSPKYEADLSGLQEIKSNRIAKNHAQMMALTDALAPMIGLNDDQHDAVISCFQNAAITRQQALAADHPIVAEFWEVVEYLENDGRKLNHSRNNDEFALNLNEFVREASIRQQSFPSITDLKKHLKQSQSRKFKDVKVVNSVIGETGSIRCWVFEQEKN